MDCLFTAWDIYSICHVRQQKALNRAILMHKKRGLRVRELNFYEYSNGAVFFDEEYLTTDNKDECILLFALFHFCSYPCCGDT